MTIYHDGSLILVDIEHHCVLNEFHMIKQSRISGLNVLFPFLNDIIVVNRQHYPGNYKLIATNLPRKSDYSLCISSLEIAEDYRLFPTVIISTLDNLYFMKHDLGFFLD